MTDGDRPPLELDWQVGDEELTMGMPADRPAGDHVGHTHTVRVDVE